MRIFLALFVALTLSACAATRDLAGPVDPVGDFRLGFTVVVTSPEYTKGPASRAAEPEEWTEPLKQAFETRFKRFEGDRFYHLGVIVEGFVLAQPGIPVVLAPKSALIFRMTVIEDSTGTQLTVEPEQLTVLEEFSPATIFGSGYVFSKEKQMELLSQAAARRAERFLRDHEEDWFAPKDALGNADSATPKPVVETQAKEDKAEADAVIEGAQAALESVADDPLDESDGATADTPASN